MPENKNSRFHVVITGPPLVPEAMDLLSGKCTIKCTEPYQNASQLAQILRQEKPEALLVRTGKVTAEVIQASPRLKVIAKHGAGVDNIEVNAATRLGIPVLNASLANYESVAEHVLGLMFALAKDIPRLDGRIRQGFWDKTTYRGVELFGRTVGLIGFGRIGRRVSELVFPLQMKVLVYDPFLKTDDLPGDVTFLPTLESLLKSADIVSLHCPLTEETRHLIGEKELKVMKETAWLINTARGEVVDEKALVAALREGEIAAAGLDTFSQEPPRDINALCQAGKTVLSPHIAGVTEESYRRMGVDSAQNILTILEGKKPARSCVVNPEVLEGRRL